MPLGCRMPAHGDILLMNECLKSRPPRLPLPQHLALLEHANDRETGSGRYRSTKTFSHKRGKSVLHKRGN